MYPMSDWTAKIKIMMRETIRPVNCSSKEIILCNPNEGVNYKQLNICLECRSARCVLAKQIT